MPTLKKKIIMEVNTDGGFSVDITGGNMRKEECTLCREEMHITYIHENSILNPINAI
jgi:hypothetical protein